MTKILINLYIVGKSWSLTKLVVEILKNKWIIGTPEKEKQFLEAFQVMEDD